MLIECLMSLKKNVAKVCAVNNLRRLYCIASNFIQSVFIAYLLGLKPIM